jgi:hypothetical protein
VLSGNLGEEVAAPVPSKSYFLVDLGGKALGDGVKNQVVVQYDRQVDRIGVANAASALSADKDGKPAIKQGGSYASLADSEHRGALEELASKKAPSKESLRSSSATNLSRGLAKAAPTGHSH